MFVLPSIEHYMAANRPRTRIYTEEQLFSKKVFKFRRDQAFYLTKVLRLKSDATVGLFNGRDGEWVTLLEVNGAREVIGTILDQLCLPESSTGLTLAFSPIKKAPLEVLLIKATELGAQTLQPVITEYTNAELGRLDRLKSLLVESAEQCERCTIPALKAPLPLAEWVSVARDVWVAKEAGPVHSTEDINERVPKALLVGPEGGFSPGELQLFEDNQLFTQVNLGPRILKSETAGIALMTLAQLARGQFDTRPAFRS